MLCPPVQFGIVGFGLCLGEDQDVEKIAGRYVNDPERVVRWGYHTFHRAPVGATSISMAAQASCQALVGTGTAAEDVDLVVLVLSEMPDYHYWDSSAALARELKINGRQTLLLSEGCASGVTGLGVVAGLLAVQPELETVLYVVVNRVSEYHRNRMTVNSSVHSDGAVAAVVTTAPLSSPYRRPAGQARPRRVGCSEYRSTSSATHVGCASLSTCSTTGWSR